MWLMIHDEQQLYDAHLKEQIMIRLLHKIPGTYYARETLTDSIRNFHGLICLYVIGGVDIS